MSQLYVPQGTWTLCTEGKMPVKIEVRSQSTITVSGRLGATEFDRFDGNFVCIKMVLAGALIGALVGAAIALTGGAALVGVLGAMAAASATGAVIGKVASMIPSICSILTSGSEWTVIHGNVHFEHKRALLKEAKISCLLGGMVNIEMKNLQEAIDMGMLANNIYDEGAPMPAGYGPCPEDELPADLKDMTDDPWVDDESGFKARLYKGPDGKKILVFQGTNPTSMDDWKNNLQQGVGMESEQYKRASTLSAKLEKEGVQVDNVAGHSLGGGLAALSGAQLNVPTYTYNAAGVNHRTFEKYGVNPQNANDIQAYSSDDDILTSISDNREMLLGRMGAITYLLGADGALPRNNGQRIELFTDAPSPFSLSPAEGHNPKYIIAALEEEKRLQGKPVNVIAKSK